jgi:phosphoribosylformylglycinamidine cyclo-ligase
LVDYLAVEEPDPKVAEEIAEGLVQGAKESQIAIIGGETASLPGIVKDFDLAGTGIGFVDKDKIITGADIEEGDILIGLRSSGIHSNGLSLARRAIFEEGGFSVDDKMPNSDITIGEELLKPTQLYVKAIVELLKHDFNIKGLAHMTGGGVNNLSRLKKGIGFDITDYPEPQDIFKLIYEQGVPLEEMYKVFNMGIGFCVIASPEEADAVLEALNENIESYKVGTVTSEEKITVKTFEGTLIEY